jgi:hypothetical protein
MNLSCPRRNRQPPTRRIAPQTTQVSRQSRSLWPRGLVQYGTVGPTGLLAKQGPETRIPALYLPVSVSVAVTRAGDIAGREPDLEAANGTVIPKVRTRLGRVVAGEHDGHGRAVGRDRLRIVYAAAEEVRVVSRVVYSGRDPRRYLLRREHVDAGEVDQRGFAGYVLPMGSVTVSVGRIGLFNP